MWMWVMVCVCALTANTETVIQYILDWCEWAINYEFGANQIAMIFIAQQENEIYALKNKKNTEFNVSLILFSACVFWLRLQMWWMHSVNVFSLNEWQSVMKVSSRFKSNPSYNVWRVDFNFKSHVIFKMVAFLARKQIKMSQHEKKCKKTTSLTSFFFCSFSNSKSFIFMASEIVGNCASCFSISRNQSLKRFKSTIKSLGGLPPFIYWLIDYFKCYHYCLL